MKAAMMADMVAQGLFIAGDAIEAVQADDSAMSAALGMSAAMSAAQMAADAAAMAAGTAMGKSEGRRFLPLRLVFMRLVGH